MMEDCDIEASLERLHKHSISLCQKRSVPTLPSLSVLDESRSTLQEKLPKNALGIVTITNHLLENIAPALNGSSLSPNYYGFVTGGVTPAARIAEGLVSMYDQNPFVHLPGQTIATHVEDKALRLLLQLLHFDESAWSGVFTTGATASNVLGLACGREYIINKRLKGRLGHDTQETLGNLGLLRACSIAQIEGIHIYTTMAHSSLYKAASILGLGRSSIKDICGADSSISFDFSKLEKELESSQHDSVSIVVISCAEVNTGLFATSGYKDLDRLRALCDSYGAWLHVDGGRF